PGAVLSRSGVPVAAFDDDRVTWHGGPTHVDPRRDDLPPDHDVGDHPHVFGLGIVNALVLVEHLQGAFGVAQPQQLPDHLAAGGLHAPGIAVTLPHQGIPREDGGAVPDDERLDEMEGVPGGAECPVDEDPVEHHVTGPVRSGACLHASLSITPRMASTASHTSTCRW